MSASILSYLLEMPLCRSLGNKLYLCNLTGVSSVSKRTDLCKNNNLCNLSGASDTAFVDYDAWFFCFVFVFEYLQKKKKLICSPHSFHV